MQAKQIYSKNVEIERTVDEMLYSVLNYPLTIESRVNEDLVKTVKQYYYWYFYQSFLRMITNSLTALKDRFCASSQSSDAVFDVRVVLRNNALLLRPST